MTSKTVSSVSLIPLERPASIRRHLPSVADEGWMVSDFVIGDENSGLRYLFDEATIRSLYSLASPIVLYGEKGCGKTALSITLAVRWARLTGSRPLCFTTGKAFAADYAEAVEIDDIDTFRSRHRECKLLVVDDLEPITDKPAAQDELTATIDCLAAASAPVIVSTSKLPSALAGIRASLSSRLAGGFSIQLLRPTKLSQFAIVESLVQDIDPALPVELIKDFCSKFDKPLRVTDLKVIVTMAHQNKNSVGEVDFSILSPLLRQHLNGDALSIANIAKVVARRTHIKLSDLRSSTRDASIVRARGLAILLARKLTSSSLKQIGTFLGGRDHSTILHAYRKTHGLLETDSELANLVSNIQAELLN